MVDIIHILIIGLGISFIEGAPSISAGVCISECRGLPNGHYQSCISCDVYASCVAGTIIDNRPCPHGTVWDDNSKRCDFKSSTCFNAGTKEPITQQEEICITSCYGLADGDYQSCKGCRVYASCSGGYLYDNRPCPAKLFWDDNQKRCSYESSTCFEISESSSSSNNCVSSCSDKENGDYQSCEGCDVYLSCVGGSIIDKRLCPLSTFWDDIAKTCLYESSTCTEQEWH